ncbi:VCBS repeat-containing protein [Methylorubrum salsuginis]|uniref:VCBS repeat-containing protein n=2 Tax=Methylorubrum salsuginis TaxID=414703 RepID=A0A1I4AJB0_9HYPH|nr:VCBS repeat-containing protein [Methylorubrum salsuginis]
MLYAGTYTGTIHTYCADFNYSDPITFTISRSGVIDLPWSYQGKLSDGTIDGSGLISGLSITVQSLSLGSLRIDYAATSDGTHFSGSGSSINGIVSTITATRTVPTYEAASDYVVVTEDSGVPARGNLLDNDNDPLATVTTVAGKAVAATGTTVVVGTYGRLTIGADGAYSYALDNTHAAVNALKDGQSLSDFFSYQAGNAKGSDGSSLWITINGRTDPKVPVNGTSGNDTLLASPAAETFSGGKGSDTVSYARAKAGVAADLSAQTSNSGDAVDDTYVSIENLKGSAFADTLRGDAHANILDGSGGADWLVGGAGNDTYIVDNVGDTCSEYSSTGGVDLVVASVSYKLGRYYYSNLENLTLAGKAHIDGTGNELANTLHGNGGNNILDGDLGADKLYGGLGNDTYLVDNAGDRVFEKASEGKDTVRASVSYVLAAGQAIETLELAAGRTNFDLTGNGEANTLRDNAGDNRLDGGAGDDLLVSTGGRDVLIGGAGSNGAVIDRAGATIALSFVMKSVGAVTTLVGDGTTATGLAHVTLTGGTGNDTFVTLGGTDALNGGAGNDRLDSGAGNDRLDGGTGADSLVGGLGNDIYVVDDAGDRVFEARKGGTDTILTSTSYALAANQEIEALEVTGTARRTLVGNEFGQTLTGNANANVLDGKLGSDLLIGGRGGDTFVFSTALQASNVDRIADFAAEDTIRLGKSIVSALAPGELAESAFKNVSKGTVDADDRILYKQTTGELFYDADGSGQGAAVKFAVLDNKAALNHTDFLIL